MRILGEGILKAIKTLADGGVDYIISTSPPKENPFGLIQKPVVFLIQEGVAARFDIDEVSEAIKESGIESKMPVGKTPSQRLRNVLYVLWEQSTQEKEFKEFYKDKLEEIINHFKSKLE